jgi:SSS family solute:Na+ symporter
VAFLANLAVVVVLTVVLRAAGVPEGADHTILQDFHADAGDPGVEESRRSVQAKQDADSSAGGAVPGTSA